MKAPNIKGWVSRKLLSFYLHNRAPRHWLGDAMQARQIRNRVRKRAARLRIFRHNA